jgi:hypothetical protein
MKPKRTTKWSTAKEIYYIWLMILGSKAPKSIPKGQLDSIRINYNLQWCEASQSYTAPEEEIYAKLVESYGERVTRHGATYGELRHRAYERLVRGIPLCQ